MQRSIGALLPALLTACIVSLGACGSSSSPDDGQHQAGGDGGGEAGNGGEGGNGGTGGAGGGGGTGGSGGEEPTTGSIDVQWKLEIGEDVTDCFSVGAEWVQLEISATGQDPIHRTVACGDGSARFDDLDLATYSVEATLLTWQEDPVEGAAPLEGTAALTREEPAAIVALGHRIPAGKVAVRWTIHKDGEVATCKAVEASSFELLLDHESGILFGDLFECSEGEGISRWMPLGKYQATFSLLYGGHVVLIGSEPIELELATEGATVEVEEIDFIMDDPGPL